MLSKCANPECSTPFRYFHTGKLFRMETSTGLERRRAMGVDGELSKPLRRVEFFWLCQACAGKMTLTFEKDSGVKVCSSEYAQSAAA